MLKLFPKNKLRKFSERQLEVQICNYLDYKKITYWLMKIKGEIHTGKDGLNFMKKSRNVGFPDMLVCINGEFITFEFKVGKNKPTLNQIFQENKIKSAGGQYYIIRSLEDVINIFKMKELKE